MSLLPPRTLKSTPQHARCARSESRAVCAPHTRHDRCGVLCLASLSIACKSTRETVQLYNLRTKRIFPVRCGGFDHEYDTFWKEFDRERKARARKSPSSTNFISDMPSIRDSLSLSGGTDEALHPSDPSRPTPEVNGLAAGAKSNPPTPMLFSIGSAQACSTFSVSTAKTKRHRYFTRSSKRNNEG